MRLLTDILYKAGLEEIIGTTNVAVSSITFDSRKVKKDSLFIAVKGTAVDGHHFIAQAIETGAIAIVCEELPETQLENITYVKVKNANYALGIIAANFYDNPSQKLKLVGVTGTNGKTTTVTLLYNLFKSLGYTVGLLSTVKNKIHNEELASTHTTPDAIS
ncbi:MAG TPA: Mur ligase domain-containing protein, partial [Bacteroidia bacterium]|nr:Mur ligase domain-containing protein [Bacteroidia bacterium]